MFDLESPPLKIRNFGEAIKSLEDVQVFLDSKGCNDEVTVITSAVDSVVSLHCTSLAAARQSTLDAVSYTHLTLPTIYSV